MGIAGQELLRNILETYFRNIDEILLLFDINNKSTFEDVNNFGIIVKKEEKKSK